MSGAGSPPRERSLPSVLARNTVFNLATQGALAGIAVWSLPVIIAGLSKDGFGLLSLVWSFLAYFTLLDFGISRAATKFLSEEIARGDESGKRRLIWTSLAATALFGIVTAAVVALAAPLFVRDLFRIEPAMRAEAERAFLAGAAGVPFMLVLGTLKGFQMALQRFDLVNAFQGATGIIQWGGAVVLVWSGYGVGEIITLTVVSRAVLACAALAIMPVLVKGLMTEVRAWDRAVLRRLLTFGGWLTVSQIVSPLFTTLDRMFVGMFLSLSAVAYYTVPQEALTRLLIIPMSLTTTLFPALSEQSALSSGTSRAGPIYRRSLKYLVVALAPMVFLFLVFADDLLTLWLGAEFAGRCVTVFRILSCGFLFNALAQVPTTALHAFGRPDLTAKFHLAELPLTVILSVILIPWIGVEGAALAWSVRVAVDAGLLWYAASSRAGGSLSPSRGRFPPAKQAIPWVALAAAFGSVFFVSGTAARLLLTAACLTAYAGGAWKYGFDEADRSFFVKLPSRIFGRV